MKLLKQFSLMIMLFTSVNSKAQVGIGTTNPLARLHVTDSSVLFSAAGDLIFPTGNVPISGAGRRMMWYSDEAAFRVGYVGGTEWDKDSIGFYSFAGGRNNTASGNSSTAMGNFNNADGNYSTAMGNANIASGISSTSMGDFTQAYGDYSTAMGSMTYAGGYCSFAMGFISQASGNSSIAMGDQTRASGHASTAMGFNTLASGDYSTAMGYYTTANGNNSVALGTNVNTNHFKGSFFFGDSDPHTKGIRFTGVANEFAARFNGGYFFIAGDVGDDVGVHVVPGGNSWSTISDVNRKENFEPVNGENFLEKIASFNLSSWNYKGQDAKTFRHYGPMAQEFYKAFGKDDYGIIGCDTLINQQDFLGVNLIAIQALEKRTVENKKENEVLKRENEDLKVRLEKLEKIIANKQ